MTKPTNNRYDPNEFPEAADPTGKTGGPDGEEPGEGPDRRGRREPGRANLLKWEALPKMKATGIVRRIDDLGRVVIPKEIRRTMRIREGDPLEIYTDREGEVIFKKYSPIGELSLFAGQYAETLHRVGDLAIVICDRDAVIACAGVPKREYAEKQISPELEALSEARAFFEAKPGTDPVPVTRESGSWAVSCAMPIISGGDLVGCVASVTDPTADAKTRTPREVESKLVLTAAGFLGRQMEE